MKENKVGSTVVSSYDYSVNDLGQRTAVDTAGSAFTAGERDRTWSYDALGQVTAESDANNTAFHRGFAYDAIGNRTASIEGNTDPTQAGATNYTPTALNQYDAIGVFSPTYDDDGNQLASQIRPLGSSSLESCVFIWDAENRLIEIKDAAGATTLASYTYDSQSRRIARTVGTSSIITLYDAWNPIAEYTGTPATGYALQSSYLWGLDLSGSMQGAGGVGGLLSVTSGAGSFYPTYDGNGNVSEYLDTSGVAVAHYEYDAFGNVIFSSGASAASFQHRFSTKPQDAESGLYYYGYRYYDPVTGGWPSRDPIEEAGGVNLYGFVLNNSISLVDVLGLRALTREEQGVVIALEDLAFQAERAGDEEFSKAIQAVQKSYHDLINKLPELGRRNTHRSQLTTKALLLWSDHEKAATYLKASGVGEWKGKNKCNKYVADVIGFQEFFEHGIKGFVKRPPIAGEWANPKLFSRSYTAIWKVVPETYGHGGGMVVIRLVQNNEPRLGDIVVFGEPTSVGSAAHVGIYLGEGVYVSATSSAVHGQVGLVIKDVPDGGTPQILYRSTGE